MLAVFAFFAILLADRAQASSFEDNFYFCDYLPRTEVGYSEECRFDISRWRCGELAGCAIELSCQARANSFAYRIESDSVVFVPRGSASKYSLPVDYTIIFRKGGLIRKACITLVPVENICDASVELDFSRFTGQVPLTSEIYIAGDMNSWGPKATRLLKNPATGRFVAKFPGISRGVYKYKFVVGDKWLPDPSNDKKESDGFGSFNSLLVAGAVPERALLVPGSFFRSHDGFRLTIGYRGSFPAPMLSCSLGGISIPEKYIRFDREGKFFEVDVPVKELGDNIGEFPALKYYSFAAGAGADIAEMSDEYLFYRTAAGLAPAAFRDSVIYFAMTDRFRNGDPSNDSPIRSRGLDMSCDYRGGDWAGIMEAARENYFGGLGVDMLWISPVLAGPDKAYKDSLPPGRMFSGYHGYWPEKIDSAERRFGRWDELARSVSELRNNYRIEVLMDAVFRHVTEKSRVFKKHPGFFLPLVLGDGTRNIRLFDKYPETTWFDDFLPAFDYEKAEAREFMVNAASLWIERSGVKGFRLDAVKHIPKIFWKTLLSGKERFFTVGETIDSREKIASYIFPGMLTAQFDFPLYFAIIETFARGKKDFAAFECEVARSEKTFWSAHRLTSNLLGNHDFPRFMAYADGWLDGAAPGSEKEMGFTGRPYVKNPVNYSKLRMAWAFLMATNGLPLIYYGDEYGESGAGDPDNRRMMRFGSSLNIFEKDNLRLLRELVAFRKSHPSLFEGARVPILAEGKSYVFAKCHFDETVIAVFNSAEKPSIIKFGVDKNIIPDKLAKKKPRLFLYDALSGERFAVGSNGEAAIPVRSVGFRYLLVQ